MNSSDLNLVVVGSNYYGPNGVIAQVQELVETQDGIWVHYSIKENIFHCLIDAFKQRYKKLQNG